MESGCQVVVKLFCFWKIQKVIGKKLNDYKNWSGNTGILIISGFVNFLFDIQYKSNVALALNKLRLKIYLRQSAFRTYCKRKT